MAEAFKCDGCKECKDGFRIKIYGYSASRSKYPKGYAVKFPELDFCSFDCVATWAKEEQKAFDDFMEIIAKREKHDNNNESEGTK